MEEVGGIEGEGGGGGGLSLICTVTCRIMEAQRQQCLEPFSKEQGWELREQDLNPPHNPRAQTRNV